MSCGHRLASDCLVRLSVGGLKEWVLLGGDGPVQGSTNALFSGVESQRRSTPRRVAG
jgi:hypothetical protein